MMMMTVEPSDVLTMVMSSVLPRRLCEIRGGYSGSLVLSVRDSAGWEKKKEGNASTSSVTYPMIKGHEWVTTDLPSSALVFLRHMAVYHSVLRLARSKF